MKKVSGGKLLTVILLVSAIILILPASDQRRNLQETSIVADTQSYLFSRDIKPILDQKCLACHSCYDAPCQLKLESSEGLTRGASKKLVYDGTRLRDATPTRLYIDAQSPSQWREKGFYSVLASFINSDQQNTAPLMQQMLQLGHNNPLPANQRVPEHIDLGFDRANYCPAPDEFNKYQDKFPQSGMPLAVSGLNDNEYKTLTTWLKQGAEIDTQPVIINDQEKNIIQQWENWLNLPDKRSRLVSRYLYEHLFLGHLYLSDPASTAGTPPQFYQLIRSYTPAGEAPQIVATVRPNDDPGKAFYYRLVPVIGTIVHKTHITYRFDLARLRRYQQLFLAAEWKVDKLPDYGYLDRSNPFLTFAAIPARLRYQFLLDDAMYFVRNFIRGPVCRGQIATNVIRDQFWVMFEDPEFELYSNDHDYQISVNQYLGLPGEETSLLKFGSQWLSYQEDRNHYLNLRQKAYRKSYPAGAELEHIWNGDTVNENAFLTVFRHHNSASVLKGWQGETPLTAWVMGYPLLERTYYELVAGFDVFGSVSHQAQTRLYFDLIRNGSETNFLRFIPAASRQAIYDNWYQSSAKIKTEIVYHELDVETPSNINYSSKNEKRELLQTLLREYPELTGSGDPINRCQQDCEERSKSPPNERIAQAFRKIAAIPASTLSGIKYLPEVSFIRINLDDATTDTKDKFLVYTLLRNRRHSSVAFLLLESLRYQENLDSLTVLPGPVSSYPNLILQIKLSEADEFVNAFRNINSKDAFEKFTQRFAVGRMNPQFWNIFHSFKQYLQSTEPLQAGIYDMNRLGHW